MLRLNLAAQTRLQIDRPEGFLPRGFPSSWSTSETVKRSKVDGVERNGKMLRAPVAFAARLSCTMFP